MQQKRTIHLSKIWDVWCVKKREIDSLIDLKTRCFQLPSRTRRIVVTVRETESNPDFGSPLCWANRLVCWPSTGYLHVASGPVKAAAWQGDEIMGRAQTRSCAPENWFPTPWKNGHRGGWPREGGRGERLEHAVGSQPSRSWAGQSSKSTLPTILIMT